MLRVDTERWQQTAEQLREQGIRAEHPCSRERFLGLYEIAKGKSASRVGRESGRNPQTVMEWVHRYNAEGSEALLYRHSGGQRPLLPAEVEQSVEGVLREALAIATTPPQQRQQLPRRVGASNGWWPGSRVNSTSSVVERRCTSCSKGSAFPRRKPASC
jgi:hypothetical protein